VLPCYQGFTLPAKAILADHGRKFCEKDPRFPALSRHGSPGCYQRRLADPKWHFPKVLAVLPESGSAFGCDRAGADAVPCRAPV
jgi:hypothetical protein